MQTQLAFCTHSVEEGKSGVAHPEVLEEGVESDTIDGAPRTLHVIERLRLLPSIIVIHKVVENVLGVLSFLTGGLVTNRLGHTYV